MHARGVGLAFALVSSFAFVISLAAPTRAVVPELSAYEGTWQYADGRDGHEDIERAVSRAVARLPFFAEPIAARALRQMTGPFERVVFRVHEDRLVFRADDWGPIGASIGGAPERIPAPDGSPLRLRQYVHDGRLVQVFEHADGTRHNTFALSGDQRWLWMSVRITSPRLPDDCRFRLRYRRLDAPRSQLAGR